MAAAQRAGLSDVHMVARAPLTSFDTGRTLFFPRQAQFHPLKYLAALAQAIMRDGGRIYTGTHAAKIEGGESARIETRDGQTVTPVPWWWQPIPLPMTCWPSIQNKLPIAHL